MRTPETALDLIREFEGFRSEWYKDPVGTWTIGHGFTKYTRGLRLVPPGGSVSRDRADEMLLHAVDRHYEPEVLRLLSDASSLADRQVGALVSFSWNLGVEAFAGSTLLEMLNHGLRHAACLEFLRWVQAGGKTFDGLVRRRKAEAEMFKSGIDSVPAVEVDALPVAKIGRDDTQKIGDSTLSDGKDRAGAGG